MLCDEQEPFTPGRESPYVEQRAINPGPLECELGSRSAGRLFKSGDDNLRNRKAEGVIGDAHPVETDGSELVAGHKIGKALP